MLLRATAFSTFTPVPGGRLANRADLPIRLPNQAHHGLRYIQAGPDGRLYISIGSPCNICQPEGLQGTIISISPNGGDLRRMAWGIRNSVGFDWNGGIMYFTDNGADGMGDDTPPDELNELQPGAFYGFPYFSAVGCGCAASRRRLRPRHKPHPRMSSRPMLPRSGFTSIAVPCFRSCAAKR